MRRFLRAAWGALAAVCLPASALGVDGTFYTCVAGDCANGVGTVNDVVYSQHIEGRWRNGQTIPGERYWVSHIAAPQKRYEQVYGEDGLLVSGTTIRAMGATGRNLPTFTGTYGRVDHAFMRARIATMQEGVYALGNGVEYRGSFEYLPARGSEAGRVTLGHFIFYGDKVDTEDDEKETGLYVSVSEVVGGGAIRFQKARPDYMVVLQQQYQREQMKAAEDFASQEREKVWRTAFAILGEVSLAMAGQKMNAGLGGLGGMGSARNRFAMDLVTGVLKGDAGGAAGGGSGDAGTRLIQFATGAALGKAGGDKAFAQTISNAVARGLDKANEGGK